MIMKIGPLARGASVVVGEAVVTADLGSGVRCSGAYVEDS